MDHRFTGYKVSLRSSWAKTEIQTPLRVWTHFCFRYAYGDGRWQIFVDGRQRASGIMRPEEGLLEPNGSYIIGQEQDTFGGGYHRDQSFSGEITELNYWDTVVSDAVIEKLSACEDIQQGNALAWSPQSWKLNGEVKWMTLQRSSVCNRSTRSITLFPDRFPLKEALKLCQGRVQHLRIIFVSLTKIEQKEKTTYRRLRDKNVKYECLLSRPRSGKKS
ncbi:hypothetical protein SK128_019623 [Halocaridina rubra]|uniref:Pentraxin family member n=1 Tax=Halocaridina rubra TaxID=373956 RepID=A0AAN9A5H9_HALRR